MVDSTNYKDWYYKAKKDREYAEILFMAEEKGDNLDYSGASFHCQQCIEKYLKGYFLKKMGEFLPKVHNLSVLCKKVAKIDSAFIDFGKGCDYVNNFYFESRYPADFFIVNRDEALRCLDIANKIHDFISETENQENQEKEGNNHEI
jgi:HEPN domain-containing protein